MGVLVVLYHQQIPAIVRFSNFIHSSGCAVVSHFRVLICITLTTNDVEHLFIWSLAAHSCLLGGEDYKISINTIWVLYMSSVLVLIIFMLPFIFLNIWSIFKIAAKTSLSSNSTNSVTSGFVSIDWSFSCLWVIFSSFFSCLLIFVLIPAGMNFMLFIAGFCCILLNIFGLYSDRQVSYLESVWPSWGLHLSFVWACLE